MVMPLWDDNPFKLPVKPVVTWSLIAVNVLVFVFEIGSGTGDPQDVANNFGLLPSALIGDVSIASAAPPVLTLFTYAFLHGDVVHLLTNMIFLWVFGDDIEEALGRLRFLAFYLACGALAGLIYVASD